MCAMRRRIHSAALPLHRHSLPRLAVDGALVAIAYYLAFQLRSSIVPPPTTRCCANARSGGCSPAACLCHVPRPRLQRRWRYSSQRDYEAVARAVVAIVLLTVVAVAVVRPVERATRHGTSAIILPNGVIILFALLSLVFLEWACVPSPAAPMSAGRWPPSRGGRKGIRSVLIAGAGDGGRLVLREILRNRELGLVPVGFLDDDPAKRRLRIDGVRVRGNTEGDLPRVLADLPAPGRPRSRCPARPAPPRARSSTRPWPSDSRSGPCRP